jgi:hypothetical protein
MAIKPAEAAALVYHITRVESMPGKQGSKEESMLSFD